mgnify:FL=1
MSKYTEDFPNLSTYDFDTIMCQLRQVCGADPSGMINAQFLSRPTTAKDIAQLFYCTKYIMDGSVNLQNQYVELYTFVKDFFTNLDLQEEVNAWMNQALEDGTLGNMISSILIGGFSPVIVNSTEDMTNKEKMYVLSSNGHIYYYNQSEFVDSGLIYGESSNTIISSLIVINSDNYQNYSDANNLKQNLIYGISNTISSDMVKNLPHYNVTAILLSNGYNGQSSDVGFSQTYIGVDGAFFTRIRYSSGWSDWETAGISPSYVNLPANYTSADDLPPNKIFGIRTSLTEEQLSNLPYYGQSALLITLSQVTSGGLQVQLFIGYNGAFYTRLKTSSGFGNWHTAGIMPSYINLPGDYTSADDLPINMIFGVGSSVTEEQISNLPMYGVTGLITTKSQVTEGGVIRQIFEGVNGMRIARMKTSSGWTSWSSWNLMPRCFCNTCVDKPIEISESSKIYVFGDSITTDTHGGITWISLIADKFNCEAVSYGVGSAVYDEQNPNNIITQINNVESFNDVDIIFVAAGVNDAGAETPSDRFISSVRNTITTLKSKAPNAKLVYITPLRRGGYGGQNLEDYAGCICNIALQNACSVINGFDFPIQPWENEFTTELTDGDGLHPNLIGKHVYAQSVLNALL